MSEQASSMTAELPITMIGPSRGWVPLDVRKVWEYRELLYFFVWRDVKVRYKQTLLGALWAVIQPFFTMVVFSIFFGTLAKIPSDGVPYPIFAYCALLPWQLFSQSFTGAANSLVTSQQFVTKVYLPRLILPLSAVAAGLVDFGIAFLLLVAMMVYYGIGITAAVVTIPVFLLLALATALGVGLWIAVLNLQYRDFRYTLPFLTQIWLFVTPVAYPASLVPERWHLVLGLNPMTGVVEGFRWALLGTSRGPGAMTTVSLAVVLAVLVGGLYYFRRMERRFADII